MMNAYRSSNEYIFLNELILRTNIEQPIDIWDLTLKISKAAFMPRLDTVCLIEQALILLPNNKLNVLDLGTGSGTIVLRLVYERTSWISIGTDLSLTALTIANYNAYSLGLKELKAVNYIYSSWFRSLYLKRYGLIISNPPYISIKDLHLNKGSLPIEPTISLASSNNGLQSLFNICLSSVFFLTYGGWLLLEHGYNQGSIVRAFILSLSFKGVHSIKDYSNERITIGRLL
ncbi:HemK family protein methyltransferase [Candidatus Tremblaya phenacola]|uniref:peptide chain release factor N(5)-glutamine methyltransferase n=1 Tax=Candidatus Tremblayella phenacoccinincola TaxID=1010676 RepID=A0A2G0V6Z2_9PROT|nr:HemK family protein methyltransferase [Candidatus Tremblaya phenacola]PHN16233.1 Release factor glutamine methyltransferase [Candidatus Tremblaya phenacola]PHN16296.1 Release factor glutamine methyltransferase [Candidatus Tremblaya phenacola]